MNVIHHIQYTVGQGGFHLGIIGEYAYIYDCGGYGLDKSKWISIIDNAVLNLKTSCCKELYIFISHWHEDHYNHLIDFLTKVSTPQYKPTIRFYFPTMNEEDKHLADLEKIMFVCEYKIEHGSYSEFIDVITLKALSKFDNVIIENNFNNLPESLPHNHILRPYITHINDLDYSRFDRKLVEFLGEKYLYKHVSNIAETTTNENFWNLCTEAYKETFEHKNKKNVNHQNMLCLYCGYKYLTINCCGCYNKVNWLHTGDALMKTNEQLESFYNYFGNLLYSVDYFQIPHHCSKNNHNYNFTFFCKSCNRHFYFTARDKPSKSKRIIKPYLDDIMLCKCQSVEKISETSIEYF